MTAITEARSGIASESLQEVLNASTSPGQALQKNLAQYYTPQEWANFFASLLPRGARIIFDPQCAGGNLTHCRNFPQGWAFGFEIDNRWKDDSAVHRVIGNCVKAWELLDELYPALRFEAQCANPPFGIRWKLPNGGGVDSVAYTWKKITQRAANDGFGYFIASRKDIEKIGIHKHEWAYLYQTFPVGVFKDVNVEIGVVHWQNSPAMERPTYRQVDHDTLDITECRRALGGTDYNRTVYFPYTARPSDVTAAFNNIQVILNERPKSDYNIWLDQFGELKTWLSTRFTLKNKIAPDEIAKLAKLNGQHPLTLTTDRETRKLLQHFVAQGLYTLEPKAKEAIEAALREVAALACPIMPVTDFEKVAYCDEEDHLVCKKHSTGLPFRPGHKYELTTSTYKFNQKYTRDKIHFNEQTQTTYKATHDCMLSGQDRQIEIKDDAGVTHRFKDKPSSMAGYNIIEHEESKLWGIFEQPPVRTVAETCADHVERNKEILRTCEMLSGFTYYPGQFEYLARVCVKDAALVASCVGTGKTLMALSLIQVKAPKRALIIAPQGTLRSSESEDDDDEVEYQASQWVEEIRRFAPGLPVFQLFSYDDYEHIRNENGGTLPEGIYISYYQAAFSNSARESAPEKWDDERLEKECQLPVPEPPSTSFNPKRHWVETIGEERNGIRCIIAPCLMTLIGHHFDMVCLDEAHICANLHANVTQMLIRMQPKYRYAFTATPIPNIITNVFSLMGWICVADWFKGNRLNAAWPYKRDEAGRFSSTFLSTERDFTAEEMARSKDPEWRGKCEKASPVISSPARLLKLLRPTLAFISKEACNPDLVKCKVVDVRVPMGAEQSKLYAHFLDRANIPAKNALVRARKQTQWLRNICADPAGFRHGGPKVSSNFNPKTAAILELTHEILSRKEQVVIVCARIGQTQSIYDALTESGVRVSRIDSTVPVAQHTLESSRFKKKQASVLIMGIKCAMGHSYDDCQNLIIGSLEYAPGPKHQAEGRIFRVNSKHDVTIYCVLHKLSLEETMFETVSVKQDAATICLHGQRVPREFKPVDSGEVLAKAITDYRDIGVSEAKCEEQWPKLRTALRALTINN
jgi:hypothetical protein